MKSVIILIVLIIVSCGHSPSKFTSNNSLKDTSLITKREIIQSTGTILSVSNDTMILKRFWDEIIVPILKKDKNRVISNMNFPVTGHWTQMMKIDKKPNQATKEDFLKIYDSFFNDYFLKELTKMNYRNINKYIKNDTTLYQFGINRVLGSGDNAGGGSVLLIYYHSPSGFKLKSIQGAGGNFYYDLK